MNLFLGLLILHTDIHIDHCHLVTLLSNVPLEGLDALPRMAFEVLRLALCLPPGCTSLPL